MPRTFEQHRDDIAKLVKHFQANRGTRGWTTNNERSGHELLA